ncbi:MAG: hypothetical protein ABJA33_05910 [Pedococcus sp.]
MVSSSRAQVISSSPAQRQNGGPDESPHRQRRGRHRPLAGHRREHVDRGLAGDRPHRPRCLPHRRRPTREHPGRCPAEPGADDRRRDLVDTFADLARQVPDPLDRTTAAPDHATQRGHSPDVGPTPSDLAARNPPHLDVHAAAVAVALVFAVALVVALVAVVVSGAPPGGE